MNNYDDKDDKELANKRHAALKRSAKGIADRAAEQFWDKVNASGLSLIDYLDSLKK